MRRSIASLTLSATKPLDQSPNELLDRWLTRQDAVWVSYFVLSFIFVAIGAWLMRKRYPSKQK
ncbi:MAG: hypothetical protein EBU68_01330 [Actinobacteria bacterium]|nr:hypothetical protein [Actinomycetota bacterium]